MSTPNLPADRANQDVELLTPKERGYGQRATSFEIGTALGALMWASGVWLALTVLTFALRPENVNPGIVQVGLATILVLLGIRIQLRGPSKEMGGLALVLAGAFTLWFGLGQPGSSGWVWGCGLIGGGAAVVAALGVLATSLVGRRR